MQTGHLRLCFECTAWAFRSPILNESFFRSRFLRSQAETWLRLLLAYCLYLCHHLLVSSPGDGYNLHLVSFSVLAVSTSQNGERVAGGGREQFPVETACHLKAADGGVLRVRASEHASVTILREVGVW
jgi:hypothetical protein